MYDSLFSMRMLSDFDLIEEATEVRKITGYNRILPFCTTCLLLPSFSASLAICTVSGATGSCGRPES